MCCCCWNLQRGGAWASPALAAVHLGHWHIMSSVGCSLWTGAEASRKRMPHHCPRHYSARWGMTGVWHSAGLPAASKGILLCLRMTSCALGPKQLLSHPCSRLFRGDVAYATLQRVATPSADMLPHLANAHFSQMPRQSERTRGTCQSLVCTAHVQRMTGLESCLGSPSAKLLMTVNHVNIHSNIPLSCASGQRHTACHEHERRGCTQVAKAV